MRMRKTPNNRWQSAKHQETKPNEKEKQSKAKTKKTTIKRFACNNKTNKRLKINIKMKFMAWQQ